MGTLTNIGSTRLANVEIVFRDRKNSKFGYSHLLPHDMYNEPTQMEELISIQRVKQGSHKLWKSWKITKKVPSMEKSWNLKKPV